MPAHDGTYSEELITSPHLLNENTNVANTDGAQNQSITSTFQHALSKIQGQKWQNFFDFDKILKHITHAEKRILRGNCSSSTCRNNFPHQPATLNSPPRSPTIRCTRKMNQVQRLNGEDMRYYGVAPLQESMEVVVCSNCSGTYTKMGLNNHMMIHHRQVWNNTSMKVPLTSESYGLADNIQDNSRQLSSTNESSAGAAGNEKGTSPVEILSTNSNASTSSVLNVYTTPSGRQKSTKSKSGSGGRSRNKTKHSTTSKTVVSVATTPPKLETTQQKSTKGHSKKNNTKTSTSSAASATPVTLITINKDTVNSRESAVPVVLYSSSSNSSCSLPSTPKMPSTVAGDMVGNSLNQENVGVSFSAAHPANDAKDKITVEPMAKPKSSSSSKKKSKGFSTSVVESVDSGTSSSTNEFERGTASVSTLGTSSKSTSHVSTSSRGVKVSKKRGTVVQPVAVAVAKESVVSAKESAAFAAQVSELDQAVSSITNSLMKNSTAADAPCIAKIMAQQEVQPAPSFQNQMVTPMGTSNEESLPPHNTSDDNSILTLEDMLDSKFINEILSTADSDINFDETELEPSNQQTFIQQPANKRMRFEDTTMVPVHQQVQQHPQQLMPGVVAGEFAIFPQQQQQHYTQYNTGNMEDIKLFNNENMQQVAQLDAQYQSGLGNTMQQQHTNQDQSQLTTIDAMQLQQLLYQQQGLNSNYGTGAIDGPTASAIQQQQFSMCVEEVMQKPKEYDVEEKLMEYTTQDPAYEPNMAASSVAAATTAAAQFNVFNIPSLTDEISNNEPETMLPNLVNSNLSSNETHQYVLPSAGEGQVIYEITDNNQVSVMTQQRQQQVIAEFLTQAGYGSVENVNVAQNLTENKNFISDTNPTTDFWDDGIDDFDYTKIETVKSLNASNSSNSNDFKGIKSENIAYHNANHHTKNLEDFYNNVYLYAGIPRPLALNNFGLVKLPQSVSTTFKKHLLATRKAYNSPFTLNGNSASGMSGNGARFTSTNAKGVHNYFANNAQSSNEFLIGNITITNTPNVTNNHQQQQMLKQDGIEITINTNAQSNRVRQKGTLVVPGGVASANNKAKFIPTTLSPALGTSPSTRAGNTLISANSKIVNVSNVGTERVKFIKRPFLTKLDIPKNSSSAFSAKKISDILNGNNKSKNFTQNSLAAQEQTNDAISTDIKNNDMTEQNKRNRVQNFFERRQKLLSITNNTQNNNNSNANISTGGSLLRQPQLLKQQLMRTLSDYGVNSITQCKVSSATNNKSNSNNNNNDMMRVFV